MALTLQKVGGSRFEEGEVKQFQDGRKDSSLVCGVWGSEGKIYVSTQERKHLVVTDSVPRSRWAERYTTMVEHSTSPIVAVFPNPNSPTQVYIIYANSITECREHNPNKNLWVKKHTFQLSNAKGAEILSVSLHPKTSMFFWCEKRGSNLGLSSCCVCMREVPETWDLEFLSCIGPVVALLHSCPAMALCIVNKGVCMIPYIPDEQKQLLFFWTFVPRSLKVYVWGHSTIGDLDKTDFKAIIMHLLPVWNSSSSLENKCIISLTTHPTTLELLVLDNTFGLSYATIQDGEFCIRELCILILPDHAKHKAIENVFAVSLFFGLVWDSGVISVFDCKSGVALCTLTDLTDHKLNMWTYFGTVQSIGVWAEDGIWQFKSQSISDVAKAMQSHVLSSTEKLFSENVCTCTSTLNSKQDTSHPTDEMESITHCCYAIFQCPKCFPGLKSHKCDSFSTYCHPNGSCPGSVIATRFLCAWDMSTLAANVALGSVVHQILSGNSEDIYGTIPKELLDILLSDLFQNPVAVLSLLYSHPWYKDKVVQDVKQFLHNYENASEEEGNGMVKTILNESLYPCLKQFISLSEKFNDIVGVNDMSLSGPAQERAISSLSEVQELFQRLNLSNPDCQSLSRLSYLQNGSSQEMVESITQMMGLGVDETIQMDTKKITLYSQRWRNIFRLEWKDGRWQKHRAGFETSVNPSLGLLCNLLYNKKPDWLLKVQDNGTAVVNSKDTDERAQDHVTQSVLDCLPSLMVNPSPQSTHVHATLLMSAGQEMQAMQIILRHKMWTQALDFFLTLPEDTSSLAVLFIMMFKAFLTCKAPKEVLLKALSLVPQELSTYEVLLLLQDNGPKCEEPFIQDSQTLSVGDVRNYLQEMLKQ